MKLPLLALSLAGSFLLQPCDSSKPTAPLTILPQDHGPESAACLDGSPFGVYFRPSQNGSTRWTIGMDGGGFCYDEADCYKRGHTELGSSKKFKPQQACQCMNYKADGSLDSDCNCLELPYCDGFFFSGFRGEPRQVSWNPFKKDGRQIYIRGKKNLEVGLDFAFAHGLKEATEFVLTGGSAGGIATFLHIDSVAERVAKEAPACKHIVAAPRSGYFLNHANYQGLPTSSLGGAYAIHMMNASVESKSMDKCRSAHMSPFITADLCLTSPVYQSYIETPFYMFNSKYDYFQLRHQPLGLPLPYDTASKQNTVRQYGKDFMAAFQPVTDNPNHGAFITSCICHACHWGDLQSDDGRNGFEAYGEWYLGKTRGAASIHIDTRMPNGEGNITLDSCTPFPPLNGSHASGTGELFI